jgi:hypothetical protein
MRGIKNRHSKARVSKLKKIKKGINRRGFFLTADSVKL